MVLASRFKRIMASLFDFGICLVVILIIGFSTLTSLYELVVNNDSIIFYNIWAVLDLIRTVFLSTVFVFCYLVLIPIVIPGQTFGKKLFGIKIIKTDGNEVTFATMFVREIVGRMLFDFTSFGFTVILSLIFLSGKKRATLADVLASTIIINK